MGSFARLLAVRTVTGLGMALAPVALAFGVLGLPGATPTTLSVVLAAEAVPLVGFLPAGGVLADRVARWKVIVAGDLLGSAANGSAAAMLITGWAPVWALAVAAALGGLAGALLFPATQGIVPEIVPAERLHSANALLGLGTNVARVGGYVGSGAFVVLLGGGWSLALGSVLFVVAAAPAIGLGGAAGGRGPSVFADLREGWREFASRQWLWVVVAQFTVLVMAMQAAAGVLGPVVAKESLGGAAAWALILAGHGSGLVAGALVALRVRPRRPILVAVVLTAPAALPWMLLGLDAPLWTVVGGAFLVGACFTVFGVLWSTTMQREIPAAVLSRVSSYDTLGSLMFGPIGLLIAGPAAVAVGARPALIGCGVVILLSTAAALTSRDVRAR
jgi:MFS family permease